MDVSFDQHLDHDPQRHELHQYRQRDLQRGSQCLRGFPHRTGDHRRAEFYRHAIGCALHLRPRAHGLDARRGFRNRHRGCDHAGRLQLERVEHQLVDRHPQRLKQHEQRHRELSRACQSRRASAHCVVDHRGTNFRSDPIRRGLLVRYRSRQRGSWSQCRDWVCVRDDAGRLHLERGQHERVDFHPLRLNRIEQCKRRLQRVGQSHRLGSHRAGQRGGSGIYGHAIRCGLHLPSRSGATHPHRRGREQFSQHHRIGGL